MGVLMLNNPICITCATIFYLPGIINCDLEFVWKTFEFKFRLGNTLTITPLGRDIYLQAGLIPIPERTPITIMLDKSPNLRLFSFRLINFKNSVYYIRKQTEDCLTYFCACFNMFPIEYSWFLNFTLEERIFLDSCLKNFVMCSTDVRALLRNVETVLNNQINNNASYISFMQSLETIGVFFPDGDSIESLLENIKKLQIILRNYYNDRIFHFLGDFDLEHGKRFHSSFFEFSNIFTTRNYLQVMKVSCEIDSSPFYYTPTGHGIKKFPDGFNMERFPLIRFFKKINTDYNMVPVVLKPNGIEDSRGLESILKIISENVSNNFFIKFKLSPACMNSYLISDLYENCHLRPMALIGFLI